MPAESNRQEADGRKPPTQSLVGDSNRIRMDTAEVELNPGTGKTVAQPLPRMNEEQKAAGAANNA